MKIIDQKFLTFEHINHGNGSKLVFENNGFSSETFTQSAYGRMLPGQKCQEHHHESMIEIFYFISGKGYYQINDKKYSVKEGTYLRIDPKEQHSLTAETELRFFYVGIPVISSIP